MWSYINTKHPECVTVFVLYSCQMRTRSIILLANIVNNNTIFYSHIYIFLIFTTFHGLWACIFAKVLYMFFFSLELETEQAVSLLCFQSIGEMRWMLNDLCQKLERTIEQIKQSPQKWLNNKQTINNVWGLLSNIKQIKQSIKY